MKAAASTTSQFSLHRTFADLIAQMDKVGLNVVLWDAADGRDTGFAPCCDLCRTLAGAGLDCRPELGKLAETAMSRDDCQNLPMAWGCRVLAIPIHRRRRVIGAAGACYPPLEMGEEESLLRLCARLKLDYPTVAAMAQRDCRHPDRDAECVAGVLKWMIEHQQNEATLKDELNHLSTNLAATYEELSLLYRISGSTRVTQEPADFLHAVCDELLEVMNLSAAAAIEHARSTVEAGDTVVIAGELDLPIEQLKGVLTGLIIPRLPDDNRVLLDNDFRAPDPAIVRAVRNFVAVPLVAEDRRIGMLIGFNRTTGDFDSADMKLLSSIGNQASAFLANSQLYADRQDLLMGVLHALTATIDAKDPYTCGHSQRVAIISRRIAEQMGFAPERVEQVYLCGLLHDIGKIGVPEAVLTKPGRLTSREYEKVRLHPSIGARILGGIRQLDEVVEGLLTHHERPDGSGYPQGLSGARLPVDGLIVGLADCFDAMTSSRTYRKALPVETVLDEIRKHAGSQFDRNVVDVFLAMDHQKLLEHARQEAATVFPVAAAEETR